MFTKDQTKHFCTLGNQTLEIGQSTWSFFTLGDCSPAEMSERKISDEALGSLGKLTFPLLALRHLHPVIAISIIITIIIIINLNVSYHQQTLLLFLAPVIEVLLQRLHLLPVLLFQLFSPVALLYCLTLPLVDEPSFYLLLLFLIDRKI